MGTGNVGKSRTANSDAAFYGQMAAGYKKMDEKQKLEQAGPAQAPAGPAQFSPSESALYGQLSSGFQNMPSAQASAAAPASASEALASRGATSLDGSLQRARRGKGKAAAARRRKPAGKEAAAQGPYREKAASYEGVASKQGKAGTDAVAPGSKRLETKPMAEGLREADDKAGIRYMDDAQRKQRELKAEDGRLLYKKAPPKPKGGLGVGPQPFSAARKTEFVMDEKGKLHAGLDQKMHHSSFTAGKPVAGAGEFVTDTIGEVKLITDRSGHYRPEAKHTLQTLNKLQEQGVNLDNTRFELNRGGKSGGDQTTMGMVGEFQAGQGSVSLFQARHAVADQIKKLGPDVQQSLKTPDKDKVSDRSTPDPRVLGRVLPDQQTQHLSPSEREALTKPLMDELQQRKQQTAQAGELKRSRSGSESEMMDLNDAIAAFKPSSKKASKKAKFK